ncbi:MAG: hypothetical protein MJY71_03215 [Bacteroidaceae bacterium]|nr:hypothetical protein [Bacteroidaceae bacterium]
MILLVTRSTYWSRGRIEADAAIIESVQKELQNRGYETELVSENKLCSNRTLFEQDNTPQVVLSMARNKASLLALAALQYNGSTIINPVTAVNLCKTRSRQWFVLKFINKNCLKASVFDSVEQLKNQWNSYPCWVKTDRKAFFVENRDCCPELKGKIVVTEHINGCVVKFYAVGIQIVGWCYVSAANSRFGEISHNDSEHEYAFDLEQLNALVKTVAEKTGLSVFGGDVIVSPSGTLTLIDVNDWPSFSMCRETAAVRIADMVQKECNIAENGKEN